MSSNETCFIFSYVHEPMICIFGMITNLLNILVFLNPSMKDPSFKCMLMISISDFFYLGINSYWFTFYCGDFYLNRYYSAQIYNIYLIEYFERYLAFYSEIFLTGGRYAVLLKIER